VVGVHRRFRDNAGRINKRSIGEIVSYSRESLLIVLDLPGERAAFRTGDAALLLQSGVNRVANRKNK
jgi:hypothetical protein